jgi:hypothetical protein
MAGPWEKYGTTQPSPSAPAAAGPWAKYGAAPEKPVGGAAAIPSFTLGRPNPVAKTAPPEQDDNLLGKLVSPVDAALGAVSGALTPVIAVPGGFIKTIYDELSGKPKEELRGPEENAVAIRNRLQYQPATATGRRILETISEAAPVLEALPGMGNELANLSRATRAGTASLRELSAPGAIIQNSADDAARAGGGRLRDLVRKPQEPSLAGVGAARSPEATLRQQRAASLGLAPLTEGQATRTPEQVRFERNIAKQPEGAPLNNRFVQHNQQLLQKFDEYFDQTGAQAPTLRAAGGVVDKAMVDKYAQAQARVNAAYDAARNAGQTAEPVSYKPISDYLATKNAEIITDNAPMLKYVRQKLNELDPKGTGVIPVNDLEELRIGAGRLTQDGSKDSAFIGDVKRTIDSSMDSATGSLYQQARRMRENVANQFEDVGVIDKLLRTKRGSSDRAVALEDVVDHSLFGQRSLDDVRQVRRVLQAGGGEQGAQAWRELQGAGINKLRDTLFPPQGAQDSAGNILPRPTALKKVVADMDADGRLEFIYGKKGAEQIRDLADAAVDVNYQTGANTSGTGAAVEDMLRQRFTNILKAIPGGRPLAEYAEGRAQSRALRKKVDQALSADNSLSATQSRTAPGESRRLQDLQRGE